MAADWQDNPSNVAAVGFDVIPVNDPPHIYKSDLIVPLTILASDVDEAELHVSAKHTKDGGLEKDGLPLPAFFYEDICNSVGEKETLLLMAPSPGMPRPPIHSQEKKSAPGSFPISTMPRKDSTTLSCQ